MDKSPLPSLRSPLLQTLGFGGSGVFLPPLLYLSACSFCSCLFFVLACSFFLCGCGRLCPYIDRASLSSLCLSHTRLLGLYLATGALTPPISLLGAAPCPPSTAPSPHPCQPPSASHLSFHSLLPLVPFHALSYTGAPHLCLLPLVSFSCEAGARSKPPCAPFLKHQSELGEKFVAYQLFLGKAEVEAFGSDRCLCRGLSVCDRQSHLFISQSLC
ncbi:hypothetical protein H1C71_019268 [Ictidomys tridecemlineatus]|nr:hypothetical protein H1C71_019268 [Ictidomys tridecemlineatus]